MQVVILAGGLGTRLQKVAGNVPKALMPVAGRPFIEHQFQMLSAAGAGDVLLCVGHLGDKLETHVGDGSRFGLRVRYAHEDPTRLLGTGGALVNALPLLQETFMVMYGDSYLPIDYAAFLHAFMNCGHPAMMSVFRNNGQWDHSNTRVANGQVISYDKIAPLGTVDYIDYGLTAFQRQEIETYRDYKPPLDMAIILKNLVERKALAAWEAPRRFYEIGKPEGLAELEEFLTTEHSESQPPLTAIDAVVLHPAIFLDRDGTLNEMVYDETHGLLDSPRRPEQVKLVRGAAAFMCRARELGYKLIVVTNQPGIAKGTLTLAELEAVNQSLAKLLAAEAARWDALYFCPHHPSGTPGTASEFVRDCDCRKPKPGLLLRAAAELDVDLKSSWMVGDGLNDVQAGNSAGCKTALVTHLKLEQVERFMRLEGDAPSLLVPGLENSIDLLIREMIR